MQYAQYIRLYTDESVESHFEDLEKESNMQSNWSKNWVTRATSM